MHPDRKNFAPRVGIAWKPWDKMVVRAGYGINYNTGAYQTHCPGAWRSSRPSPTPKPMSNPRHGALTLQNGFPAPHLRLDHQ